MNQRPVIRVLIADDHPTMRAGLSSVIASSPNMCLVGAACDGSEAIGLYRQHRPDVVLMDMSMPTMDGLHATQTICKEFPRASILIFSFSSGDATVYQAMRAGAKGYLLKTAPIAQVLESIETASNGRTVLPPEMAAKLTSHLQSTDLTSREMEVLEHIVSGKSNCEIGEALFICEGTVKSHVNRILEKLHVTDRTLAAITALSRGLVWI